MCRILFHLLNEQRDYCPRPKIPFPAAPLTD
jgi:hypothetical protein